ncbi:MAG: hypothetical protein ACRENE_19335 [Polyangiaceae bacterium]
MPTWALLLSAHGCGGQVRGATPDAGDADGIAACSTPQECPFHDGNQIYCCVEHACTTGVPDGRPDGSKRPILASNYDQSCQTDTDCVAVGEGSACSVVSPCSNAAISRTAYARYQSDVATAPCFAVVSCTYQLGPCCRQGTCRMNECFSPADTLTACADAGGACGAFVTSCGTKGAGPPGSCAYPDETCCLR